ncbi:Soluble NSF attachment protein, SNAP [Parapedobacter composti]|uniref:histidine kinase n=1 Tax=Parapedobacter composti TaxID=623281 RepID=A0A1I1L6A1_9SPHI|nr:ATP-binding protein [Parapedobacter composti]SFC68541.1 Soluble NSF attachment protein, SNAP [Parapedobacter composti]
MNRMLNRAIDRRAWILVPFFCFTFLPLAAGQPADSLEREIKKGKLTDAEKITIYDDLSWANMDSDMRKSVDFSAQGLALAKRTGDDRMVAVFHRNMGVAYYMGSVYDSAAIHLDKAIPIIQRIGDDRLEAVVHSAYGNLYKVQGLYNEALDNYLKAAAYFEQQDSPRELGKLYSNIGGVYQVMINYDHAMRYFEKAQKLAEQTGDQEGLASVYTSLSDIHLYKGTDKLQSLHYAQEAVRLYQETGNKFSENMALQTVAKVHYYHDDFSAAMPIAEAALRQAEDLGFPSLIAHALIIVSNIHYHQEQYAQSATTARQVLEHDSTNINVLRNVYANLTRAHAYLGQPDFTANYLDRYREVMDRYATETYQQALSAMEVKYETEKKELKIETLEKQRRLYTWLGVAGSIIFVLALAFAALRYRLAVSRQKLAEQETMRLQQEKQLIAVQAALDGEAAERSRLARDLHDGLGSMLSVVKFTLPQMKSGGVLEAVEVSRFQKALGMLDDSIRELRRIAHHMMPESLVRYGLKASLSDFCEAIPTVDFHYFGNEARLPEKLEILVYRCIHELVNNALKHARATRINVQLVQEPNRISFTVQDDGVGFDPGTVTEGTGLQNIRQRVTAFQGTMNIYSSKQGTEIHVELELTTNEQDDKSSDS